METRPNDQPSAEELLDKINSPDDLKALPRKSLPALAEQIRSRLIEVLSVRGGHLSSNLGVVELTIALHYIFNSPDDRIIFDVGHQSYVHKLLTGRRQEFGSIRSFGGLSGFTRRSESPHDPFGGGHSSTSVSAGLGYVRSASPESPHYTIVVVGDGAFTGGMIYEALNNTEASDRLIVVLNENEQSISRNIGRMAELFYRIRNAEGYFRVKGGASRLLGRMGSFGRAVSDVLIRFKGFMRRSLRQANFFEQLGYEYLGPVDGHDLHRLLLILEQAKIRHKPVLVHVKTQKGRGFATAENNPDDYHSVSCFDPDTGGMICTGQLTFSDRFGQILAEQAKLDERICAITAAMAAGTGLIPFKQAYPERFFDVGIAEGHAATFTAGLACAGKLPVFAVYSTFMQRAFDQIIHDIALQNLHVVLAIDRAGLVGEDGPTHHGVFDVPFLCGVPNMTVYSPADYAMLEHALGRSFAVDSPHAVRYPRGTECQNLRMGNYTDGGDWLLRGEGDGLVITYGRIAEHACVAAGQAGWRLLVLNQIKPLPMEVIREQVGAASRVYILEESIRHGGVGEQIIARLAEEGLLEGKILQLKAIEDIFVTHGKTEELLRCCGLDAQSVAVDLLEMHAKA